MSLLTVLLVLCVAGVILWAINTYLPMEPGIKRLLNIVVIAVLVIWLLKAFGILGELGKVHT